MSKKTVSHKQSGLDQQYMFFGEDLPIKGMIHLDILNTTN